MGHGRTGTIGARVSTLGRRGVLLALLVPTAALGAACTTDASRSEEAPVGQRAARSVSLLDYTAEAPAAWVEEAPTSSMRLAQFRVPDASGPGGAEVVVYFFGPGQGGSVEANTARWQSQFYDEAGGHPAPTVTRLEGGSFPTTLVELRGRYARAVGTGGGAEQAAPGQALVAAVVEAPAGSLFVQLHGPDATVDAERAGFEAFVRGIRAGTTPPR